MSEPIILRIPANEQGQFALSVVDFDAVGYLDTWQAPGGLRLPAAEASDYDADSGTFVCQATSIAINSSSNVTTDTRVGTFCEPPAPSITVGEDTFTADVTYFQDANNADGLARFLFKYRTKQAYLYFGADSDNPPRAIGKVRLVSGAIGGDAHTDLTATVSFPLLRAPDVEFGTTGDSEVVRGDGLASAGLSAGGGSFSPTDADVPANLAALQASGIVATPSTAWTTGQKVTLGDTTLAHWTGTAWASGAAT